MRRCGEAGCEQWAYGSRCYFHEKVEAGLLKPRNRDDEPLLNPAAVASDERTSVFFLAQELEDMSLLKTLAPEARVLLRRRRRGIRMHPGLIRKGA